MPRYLTLLLITLELLSACGTKGPLYIPERQYPQYASSTPHTDSFQAH